MTQTHSTSDHDLLAAYAVHKDHVAFEALVDRHARWLFAAAYRQLKDAHLAQDAVQVVFVLLAQRAKSMHRHQKLSGWLFNTLRFTVKNLRRNRHNRLQREQAVAKSEAVPPAAAVDLADQLDAAVARLSESDRLAILLRFYQEAPFDQLALALDTTEAAARKRVDRAL